jgi:glycosyltransferase involved in cell wall biosynthesis
MRIGILGTRGIPNHYGGFEQLAEFLSVELVNRGHQVWVYNSSLHPFKEQTFHGVEIITCYDPESNIGTMGQFVYDFNCILDSRSRNFDVLLQLGYTSSSIWNKLLPENSVHITNMDGMEWMRSKYHPLVQKFLKLAEKWAVSSSNYLIADSLAIQDYLLKKYQVNSSFIAYGAHLFRNPNLASLQQYHLVNKGYYLAIARFEPENNLELIIQGYLKTDSSKPLIIIGNTKNKFGQFLTKKYASPRVVFLGSIYDLELLNNLRFHCALYFHGHSVGGTNPSLLEAMASLAPICAHQNEFNKAVLGNDALYFLDVNDVKNCINSTQNLNKEIELNAKKIETQYNWIGIFDSYEELMKKSLKR